MLLRTLDDGLEIHRITTEEEADVHREAFVAAYREVFSKAPYAEAFTREEAGLIWDKIRRSEHAIVLLVLDGDELAAFAACIPLADDPPVARALRGLVPTRHTMYMAELGVRPGWGDRRLASKLVNLRLQLIPDDFSHVVLRLVEGKYEAAEFYRSKHFTEMGVSMTVTRRRTDGVVRDDERAFMSRVLSQVETDEE